MTTGFQQEQQAAGIVSKLTGIDKNVALTQMVQENGYSWPASNNPGNISYTGAFGQTGYFVSSDGTKIADYGSPLLGISGYADLLNSSTYHNVSQQKGDVAQLKALQSSPWDAAHYPTIMNTYAAVMAKEGTPVQTPTGTTNTSGTPSTSNQTGASLPSLSSNKMVDYALVAIGLLIIGAVLFKG